MKWQNYFHLSVQKFKTNEIVFEAQLKPVENHHFEDLIISRFNRFKLSELDKKKLSLDMRKIILEYRLFESAEFKKICENFKKKIQKMPEKELILTTQGGGIYLFMQMLNSTELRQKKIICYTSELPLPFVKTAKKSNVHFIYSPKTSSFLSHIPSLWSETEIISLFELKDFKASA